MCWIWNSVILSYYPEAFPFWSVVIGFTISIMEENMASKVYRTCNLQLKDDLGLVFSEGNSSRLQAKPIMTSSENNINQMSWSSILQSSVDKMECSLSFIEAKFTNGTLQVSAPIGEIEKNISY